MPFSYKPLWKLLVDQELTKTEFRESLGLSTATLAKLGKDEYVSLEIIDKIDLYTFRRPAERYHGA
ncbi:helix-turn-helix domain-containing protein [Paenibacillus tyrfis]|uniref:helix-turn-helix domain-containing protein n=1 Tax=Paenibacillus tyrfis TaxID=1501230 RepID=UPI0028154361|nr:helix-turn-helix domain-containing protein [Paenibacillus tyrfis]